ncbi:DUF4199 domain-containing protein [Flavobacterium rhizosphaerae]|uniref:DUF4199 domain-containing protein n=1 Tax=Flavobacterium rhizosphaerae TaxID=3163298 RepID=A0ABW8YRM4_9FLAO
MKKTVLVYGLLAGFISTIGYLISIFYEEIDMNTGMMIGYASMLAAFSLIFVATVNYRKQHGGTIGFGKAFQIGLYISLIASTIYVLIWLYCLYNVYPDFAQHYAEAYLEGLKSSGKTAAEIAAETASMDEMVANYKKLWYVIPTTYAEILPIGLIASVISAAILKRKPNINLQ